MEVGLREVEGAGEAEGAVRSSRGRHEVHVNKRRTETRRRRTDAHTADTPEQSWHAVSSKVEHIVAGARSTTWVHAHAGMRTGANACTRMRDRYHGRHCLLPRDRERARETARARKRASERERAEQSRQSCGSETTCCKLRQPFAKNEKPRMANNRRWYAPNPPMCSIAASTVTSASGARSLSPPPPASAIADACSCARRPASSTAVGSTARQRAPGTRGCGAPQTLSPTASGRARPPDPRACGRAGLRECTRAKTCARPTAVASPGASALPGVALVGALGSSMEGERLVFVSA